MPEDEDTRLIAKLMRMAQGSTGAANEVIVKVSKIPSDDVFVLIGILLLARSLLN